MNQLLSFALVVFIASFTPGPNNNMLLQSGMVFGFRRSLPHISGIIVGFNILFHSVRLGLSRLFELFPVVLLLLKILGSLYFIYISWKMFHLKAQPKEQENPETEEEGQPARQSKAQKPFSFGSAVLFQWVNVKAWFFAISTNANVPPKDNFWAELPVGLVILFFTVASTCSWALLGQSLERIFSKPLYARIINSILSLSLLYVVFTWWQDALIDYFARLL